MIIPKSKEEIEIMREGGKVLAMIKKKLKEMIRPGTSAWNLEEEAVRLIESAGMEASFKKVPGYRWATCINVNEGIVHGIPKKEVVFKEGDIVSVDVGVLHKGMHTDSAFTVPVGRITTQTKRFLKTGERALKESIAQARVGKRIAHISRAIQKVVTKAGYSPTRDLTGHGVGRNLHESPMIPCFWDGNIKDSEEIIEGATLAIEVIYVLGSPDLALSDDQWTIATRDGKISALFEETVAVINGKPLVLTA